MLSGEDRSAIGRRPGHGARERLAKPPARVPLGAVSGAVTARELAALVIRRRRPRRGVGDLGASTAARWGCAPLGRGRALVKDRERLQLGGRRPGEDLACEHSGEAPPGGTLVRSACSVDSADDRSCAACFTPRAARRSSSARLRGGRRGFVPRGVALAGGAQPRYPRTPRDVRPCHRRGTPRSGVDSDGRRGHVDRQALEELAALARLLTYPALQKGGVSGFAAADGARQVHASALPD